VVGGPLTPGQEDEVRLAVAEAERGNAGAAESHLGQVPGAHPARKLAALEIRYLQGEKVGAEALTFAGSVPGYGSAWGFAAQAERRDGELRPALEAARRAAALQPGEGWGQMAGELQHALVARDLEQARALLGGGDAARALALAREVLAVDAGAVDARLVAVRALLALHDTRGAAAMVPGLPDSPEGLELKGGVAEALGQFDLAVDLYTRLPKSDPRRCGLLVAARRRWRLANAPPYLNTALASSPLRRKGLAAIVAFEAPAVASHAAEAVPVFEDVVELPERGDIVTVARAGIISGDPVTRRFGPERPVSPRELARTLDRLAAALGAPRPKWCDGGDRGCLTLPEVVDGRAAAALVEGVAGGGGEPCAQS